MVNHEENQNNKKNNEVITLTKEEFQELQAQVAKGEEYRQTALRLQADFENAKKRLERERQEFAKFANQEIILELLNVLDDLERTVGLAEAGKEDFDAFLKGAEMILAHLYELLKEYGLKAIEAKGKVFDPNLHEALMQVETDKYPENSIVEELQKGYLLNDKLLRTSKVKVAKKLSEKENG